jgi:hypothetical protein
MKKLITILIVVFALFAAMFANHIPGAGVSRVIAYPLPATPTDIGFNPPYYPDDYIMPIIWWDGNHDRIVAICPSCDGHPTGPGNLIMSIVFSNGMGGWVQLDGYYAGRTYPNNYPYYVTNPMEHWYALFQYNGCAEFEMISGQIGSWLIGDPPFHLNVFLPNGKSSLHYCKNFVSWIMK